MSTHHHTALGCRDTCVTSNNKIIIKYLSLEHGLKVHTIWSWQRQEKIIWHQRQCTGTAVPLQRSHIITLQLNVMETEISTEISTGPLSRYLPVCRAQLCYSLQSTSQAWSGSPASQASHRRAAASISGNMNTYILDTAVIIQISEVIYYTFLFAEEGVLSNIKCGFTWKSTYSTHTCDITRYSTIFVTLDSIYIRKCKGKECLLCFTYFPVSFVPNVTLSLSTPRASYIWLLGSPLSKQPRTAAKVKYENSWQKLSTTITLYRNADVWCALGSLLFDVEVPD